MHHSKVSDNQGTKAQAEKPNGTDFIRKPVKGALMGTKQKLSLNAIMSLKCQKETPGKLKLYAE